MKAPQGKGRGAARVRGGAAIAAAAAVAMLGGCDATIGNAPVRNDAGPIDAALLPDALAVPDAFVPVADADRGPFLDAAVPDASVPDAPPPDAAPCEGGDRHVLNPADGHCYLLFTAFTPWLEAESNCEALGAHLATSTSDVENSLLNALASGQIDVWIGGTDVDMEGTFVWVDGEPMVFQNFRTGEPNNGNGGGPENCMIIEADNGSTWDDRDCSTGYPYICERD